MSEQLGFRDSMKEVDIKNKLDKVEKKFWDSLDVNKKKEFIEQYKRNKNECIDNIIDEVKKMYPNHENEFQKANKESLIKFFTTQGIVNPTDTTMNAFKKQRINANFDNFYHAFGQMTFNMEKQAKYNYYMSQQKQKFIQIAQNDKLIKQQNEILFQNDRIIELLEKIANK